MICCALAICINSFANPPRQSTFLIIKYDVTSSNQYHKKRVYYWVIEVDSLKKKNAMLSPLYLNISDNSRIRQCCNDSVTAFFTMTSKSDFTPNENYKSAAKTLFDIISMKQIYMQSAVKVWPKKGKETIKVYIIPVIGSMCNCVINKADGELFDYYGRVYLPNGMFRFNDDFSMEQFADSIILQDLLKIKFNSGIL